MRIVYIDCLGTPIGELCVAVSDGLALAVHRRSRVLEIARRSSPDVREGGEARELAEELREYFEGERASFSFDPAMPVNPLRAAVYSEVRRIPYGSTATYGEIARRVGTHPRVVGHALRRNEVLILVPCHRVVGARGLGGFELGPRAKEILLNLERARKPLGDSPTTRGLSRV
jgi:methylated-DNA-[protein]-cysteine S-methyltransferase